MASTRLLLTAFALVAVLLTSACGGHSSTDPALFCRAYPAACDGKNPRFSLEVQRTFVRGDEACFATDFDTAFPERGGSKITLCGAAWVASTRYPNPPGEIRCYAGGKRIGLSSVTSDQWPMACDAANVGIGQSNPRLWSNPPDGVKLVATNALSQPYCTTCQWRSYTPAQKAAYRAAFKLCDGWADVNSPTFDPERADEYAEAHPETSAEWQGCLDGDSDTPLPGSDVRPTAMP